MELAPLDDMRALDGELPPYADKGRRLLAFIIDVFVGYALGILLVMPFLILEEIGVKLLRDNADAEALYAMIFVVAISVYFSYMESSPRQATWGKYWLGMQVCDTDYSRLTFGKAFVRNIAKIGCCFTCYIGFLVIFFTKKSQTLADLVTSALVIKR